MRHITKTISNFFLPGNCTVCNTPLAGDEHAVCDECSKLMQPLAESCYKCAQTLSSATSGQICGACMKKPPKWQRAVIPFAYKGVAGFLLKDLKFARNLALATRLADFFVSNLPDDIILPDLIIPVPLHRKRLFSRGFNQSYEIAKIIGDKLKISLAPDVCQRFKNTSAQTGLKAKERQQNLKNAFLLKKREIIKNRHIVLFDDVYTTGATLSSLAKVCKAARRIDVWCIAKSK